MQITSNMNSKCYDKHKCNTVDTVTHLYLHVTLFTYAMFITNLLNAKYNKYCTHAYISVIKNNKQTYELCAAPWLTYNASHICSSDIFYPFIPSFINYNLFW